MTFFSEANRDAATVSVDNVATGPLVGFLDAFQASVDAQMRASSQFGIEYFMQELDWKQTQAMLDAGVPSPPQLMLTLEGRDPSEGNPLFGTSVAQLLRQDSGYYEDFVPERSGGYLDVARAYNGENVSDEFSARMAEYDARVAELRQQYPDLGLQTSEEMFNAVRESAKAAEQREQNDRRTWGGAFGGFFGAALSSLHPGTDPLNFYSLGIGGAGKTATQRILAQTGGQGVIEAVNQATGVQEERRLLGLSHGFADAATRVAATAAGAGALQGAGEILAAGARRWFRDAPGDPAPPREIAERPPEPEQIIEVSTARPETPEAIEAAAIEARPGGYLDVLAERTPLSGIRAGKNRSKFDIREVDAQLQAWDGGAPADIRPRTGAATYVGDVALPRVDTQAATENNRLYQIAREQDPETFARYDKMLEERAVYRRWLEELAQSRDQSIQEAMDGIERRLDELQVKLRATQGKNNKAKVRKQIRQVEADREELIALSNDRETPDMARIRGLLIELDESMRDLAPLIGRAYARARGRFAADDAEMVAVWEAYRANRAAADMPAPTRLPEPDAMMALADQAPVLAGRPLDKPRPTTAETATAMHAEEQKVLQEALERYRAQVSAVLSSDEGVVRIEGVEYEFDLDGDKLFIPNEEGTGGRQVTVRELLEINKENDDALEAITTCSL